MLTFDNVIGHTTQTIIPDQRGLSFRLAPGQVGVLYGGGERAQDYLLLSAGRGVLETGTIHLAFSGVQKTFDARNLHLLDSHISWRKVLGHCPQEDGLLSNLSLLENMELPYDFHGAHLPMHPTEALSFFDIPMPFWEQRPAQVPQEIRKRALMARTVVGGTELLLWESPVSNLPWEKWGSIIHKILQLKAQGKAILITTAEAPFACAVADWVLYLKDHKLFENGQSFFSADIQQVSKLLMQNQGQIHDE